MATSTDIKETLATQVEELHDGDKAVQLAHDADDTRYSPLTKGLFRLYLVLVLPYLCGCLNGYDGSLMGGIIAMSSYQDQFHM